MKHAPKKTLDRYNSVGKKLVIGEDHGPYNEGPLWIWHYLEYHDSDDKSQTLVNSPMMRTPTTYPIKAAAGFHYCKLLSPLRVLEWMAVDSLKGNEQVEIPAEELLAFLQ